MITARTSFDFGCGPLALDTTADLAQLAADDRLLITFDDCEMLFSVVGRARGAFCLGCWLSPWEFIHWRLEPHGGAWSLSTVDRQPILRLRRHYRLAGEKA